MPIEKKKKSENLSRYVYIIHHILTNTHTHRGTFANSLIPSLIKSCMSQWPNNKEFLSLESLINTYTNA